MSLDIGNDKDDDVALAYLNIKLIKSLVKIYEPSWASHANVLCCAIDWFLLSLALLRRGSHSSHEITDDVLLKMSTVYHE